MRNKLFVPGKILTVLGFIGSLMFTTAATAENDWEFEWEVYGWLPIIEMKTGTGEKSEITRDDILDDLDMTAFTFLRTRKDNWTLSSDFVYFKISDKTDMALIPDLPHLAELEKAGMQAWVIRPALGYVVHENDKQLVELYAGARYLWIEVDATIKVNHLFTGPEKWKESPSDHHWDGIVGARGTQWLSDKWFIPYSVNAGAGDSDFTWEAQAAFAYRFKSVDAVAGWRYLAYDIGSDTTLKTLSVNGPFVGAMFHW